MQARGGDGLRRHRAVFLDRDGVINRVVVRHGRPHPPASLQAVEWVPHAAEALRALRGAEFRIIVATNQPDVGTGIQSRDVVEAIHQELFRRFPIDDIKVCYHTDHDACGCRKPRAGMLREAAREWGVDLGQSVMIGDRWRDIEAGKTAGCKTILIRGEYTERRAVPDLAVDSLMEASAAILAHWSGRQPIRGAA